MPPAVGLAIAGIAAGVGSIAGAKMQANAARHAGDIQAQSANTALDWEKQQQGRAQAEYDAWLHGGPIARLDALLADGRGSAPAPAAPVNTTMPVGGPSMTIPQLRNAGSGQTPDALPSRTVTLVAPTGQTRRFAATDPQVAVHLARGAQRIA